MHNKPYESKTAKMTYILERREYPLIRPVYMLIYNTPRLIIFSSWNEPTLANVLSDPFHILWQDAKDECL